MIRGSGTGAAANAGTKRLGWRSTLLLMVMRLQEQVVVSESRGSVRLLLRRRRIAGGPEIEPEILPVVVYVIEDHNLAVTHQGHVARRRRVVIRRLVALLVRYSLKLTLYFYNDSSTVN